MKKGFTLLELIVVIIIVGVLATLGITQYGSMVEKARTAEARTVLGDIRNLVIAYWLANGTLTGMTNADANIGTGADQVPISCRPSHYFYYWLGSTQGTVIDLYARRCQAGGRSPQGNQAYAWYVMMRLDLVAGTVEWLEFPYPTP